MTIESIKQAINTLGQYKEPSAIECNQFTADFIKKELAKIANIETDFELIEFFGLTIKIKNYFPDYIYQIK